MFEFESDALGAQAALGGGGRYDGLVEQLGGPGDAGLRLGCRDRAHPAGARRAAGSPAQADVFVAAADGQRERAFALVRELRRAGLHAELDLAGRSIKGQMKQADRVGARAAVILDDDGAAQLRDMASGEQRELDLASGSRR